MDLNRNARRAPRPDRPARRAGGHLTGKSICDCPACKTGRDPLSRMRDGGPWESAEMRPAPLPADVPDADLAFAVTLRRADGGVATATVVGQPGPDGDGTDPLLTARWLATRIGRQVTWLPSGEYPRVTVDPDPTE